MEVEGIEVRELPPEGNYCIPVTANWYRQRQREIRLAYEQGAQDRFAALIVGLICGAFSGATLMALAVYLR